MMPSCKELTNHASDYLDRAIPWWKRPGYWLHLAMCVHCRRYIDQLSLTIKTIGKSAEANPPEISPEQVQDIVKKIKQTENK